MDFLPVRQISNPKKTAVGKEVGRVQKVMKRKRKEW